jgi:hypothetical protein
MLPATSTVRPELRDPIGRLVQLQPIARAAECIGENDVGAGLDESTRQFRDAVGMLAIPQLRRVPGLQASMKQVASGGAVRKQPRALGEQGCQSIGHR